MRAVATILPHLRNLPADDNAPRTLDAGTVNVVNSLFKQLKSIFPAWKQAWPDDETLNAAKATWTKAFVAARITTIEQIRFGIEQCRNLACPFAPSIGEFIALCQPTPEMFGLPPLDKAYAEATRNAHPAMANARWSHAAVYHAAAETGIRALATLPEQTSRKLFERNYQITVRAVMEGQPLRPIPLALPETISTRTPQVGNDALANIRRQRSGGAARG